MGNEILINDGSNQRNDFVCFTRILNFITHFELNNADMLEYTVKSTYRFLYKRGDFINMKQLYYTL